MVAAAAGAPMLFSASILASAWLHTLPGLVSQPGSIPSEGCVLRRLGTAYLLGILRRALAALGARVFALDGLAHHDGSAQFAQAPTMLFSVVCAGQQKKVSVLAISLRSCRATSTCWTGKNPVAWQLRTRQGFSLTPPPLLPSQRCRVARQGWFARILGSLRKKRRFGAHFYQATLVRLLRPSCWPLCIFQPATRAPPLRKGLSAPRT